MNTITIEQVLKWAESFLTQSEKELTKKERKGQHKFATLVQNPNSKILLIKMLDESSQIRNDKKLSVRIQRLIKQYGIPDFFSSLDRAALDVFTSFGYLFDFAAMPIFKKKLRMETANIIISEERPLLTNHLKKRKEEGIEQNLNLLGEVVLSDEEANNRFGAYLKILTEPDINYISIKISGIYAQLRPLNYEHSKEELCKRITQIYQQAIDYPYIDKNGNSTPKFVNLDMEEYKDVELTLDIFISVLSLPQFKHFTAGIVLQAYLPDAVLIQEKLLKFAKDRFNKGGAPLKIRLVKGANLQMESIIASQKGWTNPILPEKIDVDANYLHLLDIGLRSENAQALHVGVASHNFFTIGYALLLSQKNNVVDCVTFEMLEGMANHLPRVLQQLGKHVVLYTPVVRKENFLNAVSYLVRRLDENTSKDNFLTYSFNLSINSQEWDFLANQFKTAYAVKDNLTAKSNKVQDRTQLVRLYRNISVFKNEPDTDLDLKANRKWALDILEKWKTSINVENYTIPVQVGNDSLISVNKKYYYDRSKIDKFCTCEANLASLDHVKQIVEIAAQDNTRWRTTSLQQRNEILHQVAENLSAKRGDLIGCMVAITGKTFSEGDVEVSEAIDFCRFYPISMSLFDKSNIISYKPKGVILVISPWNFPLAIPIGGIAAALSGGNTVILKPATAALPIAWEFAKCFWDAGISKEVLQIVCPSEKESLDYLVSHPFIKHTILTGGTDTAFKLLQRNPRIPLSAETGGKNAIILTSSGDQDHAIQNILTSAFGNAGQKCSACSLLLLEKSIFYDKNFQMKLKNAVKSLHVGSSWSPDTVVSPMISNDNQKLEYAINNLESGESWLVEPEYVDNQKYILKPCVKWGVVPQSFTFKHELFVPLLAVVCIDNLSQGIEYVNSSDYGLTSGLQSLDENEIELWSNKIEAGNLYINRAITGAIVKRQPFGGMKRSAFGGGLKAGGQNYVTSFVNFTENDTFTFPEINDVFPLVDIIEDEYKRRRVIYAITNYKSILNNEFSKVRDVSNILGESTTVRYIPLKHIGLRVNKEDCLSDILLICYAINLIGSEVTISVDMDHQNLNEIARIQVMSCVKLTVETEEQFLQTLECYERIRTCSPYLSDHFYAKAAELGKYIATAKPIVEGRIELLHYLQEQSISFEYHRYGNILDSKIFKVPSLINGDI